MDPDDWYPEPDILEVLYSKAIQNNVNICGGSFSEFRDGNIKSAKGLSYTLQLITPHVTNRANSYMDDVPLIQDRFIQTIMLSPEDAESRGISDGDEVYVYNDLGCVKRPATVSKKIAKGVVALNHGAYYRPSLTETYEAWFDTDGDGIPEKHITPVDLGGNPNVITDERNSGVTHPYRRHLGVNANGHACEVSKVKPI